MNFFSHLAVASMFTEDPIVALGAMLPDWASMLGMKPPQSNDARMQRGYDLHYATDRTFHALPSFLAACRTESARLRHCGIERGSARAAAHVGLEFFLDEALADDGISRRLYSLALNEATPQRVVEVVSWTSAEQATAFEALRLRLATAFPSALSHSERICRTLSRRPRLAVRADDRTALDQWTAEAPARYAEGWPGVVKSVTASLERASWNNVRSGGHPLRFRRAQPGQV